MELAMANGFYELSQNEMMETDGGIDWWGVVTGFGETIFGLAESLGGAAAIIAPIPEPATKIVTVVGGAAGVVDGLSRGAAGLEKMVNSFKE